jgi:hypothetical protein
MPSHGLDRRICGMGPDAAAEKCKIAAKAPVFAPFSPFLFVDLPMSHSYPTSCALRWGSASCRVKRKEAHSGQLAYPIVRSWAICERAHVPVVLASRPAGKLCPEHADSPAQQGQARLPFCPRLRLRMYYHKPRRIQILALEHTMHLRPPSRPVPFPPHPAPQSDLFSHQSHPPSIPHSPSSSFSILVRNTFLP